MASKLRENVPAYFFILPAFLLYTGIMILPMFDNLRISFTNWDGFSAVYKYVGLSNYKYIFSTPYFFKALNVTLFMSFFIIVIQLGVALFMAVALEEDTCMNRFFRSLFFIPSLLNTVVISVTFSYALSINFGFLPPFFKALGMEKLASIEWLADIHYAKWVSIMATVWMFAGLNTVIFLGALINIPKELLESAQLDGASPWARFYRIKFPMIAPAITVNVMLTLIGCIRLFDIPYILSTGGPARSTETLAILLYKDAFNYRNAGRGAADGVILLVLVFTITALAFSYLKRREDANL